MALPGFEGRLGRLGVLGRSIAWGLGTTVATGVLTVLVAIGGHASPGLRTLFVAATVVPIALYWGVSIQTRRLNDMGWPALPVIGGWCLVGVLDVVLALSLLLWPGRDDDDLMPRERNLPASFHRTGQPEAAALPAPMAAPVRPASVGRRRA